MVNAVTMTAEGNDVKIIPIIDAVNPMDLDRLKEAYRYAELELAQAESNFNYADSEYIDIAIYELNAKQAKRNMLYKEYLECERKFRN